MTRIELAPEVFGDFDRLFDALAQTGLDDAERRVGEVVQAIQILTHSPHIGRKVKGGKRELVVGHRSCGYFALYRFVADIDAVFVLALRSQREVGFKRGP